MVHRELVAIGDWKVLGIVLRNRHVRDSENAAPEFFTPDRVEAIAALNEAS